MFEGFVGSGGAIHCAKIGSCLSLFSFNETVVFSMQEFNVSWRIELTQTGLTGFAAHPAGQNARNCPIPEDLLLNGWHRTVVANLKSELNSAATQLFFFIFLGSKWCLRWGMGVERSRHREIRDEQESNRGGHSALLASSLASAGSIESAGAIHVNWVIVRIF